MYYTRLGGENLNKLIYYCRKCGHEDDLLSSDQKNICVSKTHLKTDSSSFHHMVNEYTKLDPTLPRVKNIPCPNISCSSNVNTKEEEQEETKEGTQKSENDIIYLRYDDANLKYVYICANCNYVWKTSN
jgi:DNA-directed RNA polymerase subunit M/transcription elongation factor TFIIS